MSESKAEYYAKHLNKGYEHIPMDTMTPSGLPTLLARMVGEYTKELCLHISSDISGGMAIEFNRALMSAAQPLLTAYLDQLTNPPMVVKKQEDEANLPIMVRTPLATDREMSQQERIEIERGKRR